MAQKAAAEPTIRVFKTKAFSKQAKKAGITDSELREAAEALAKGQGDDLGGNVWKKRLNKNLHRSIVVEKVEDNWIFVFLFAKSDMDNIEDDELAEFKDLADVYAKLDIEAAVKSKALLEITKHG